MVSHLTRVLVLTKTAPAPDLNTMEPPCVVGLTETGQLTRITPVPFRLIEDARWFERGQWLTMPLQKAPDDARPETHRFFVDGVRPDDEPAAATPSGYRAPVQVFEDFATLQEACAEGGRTLALLRPRRIAQLRITPVQSLHWSESEERLLQRMQRKAAVHDAPEHRSPTALPAKVCFHFHVIHESAAGRSSIHKVVDWYLMAHYRALCDEYGGTGWQRPFRERYEQAVAGVLVMGSAEQFPKRWLVLGLLDGAALDPFCVRTVRTGDVAAS